MTESMFYFQQHSDNIITNGPRLLVASCFKKHGLLTQMCIVSMRLFNPFLPYRFTAVCLHAHVCQKYTWLFKNPGEVPSWYKKNFFLQ